MVLPLDALKLDVDGESARRIGVVVQGLLEVVVDDLLSLCAWLILVQ